MNMSDPQPDMIQKLAGEIESCETDIVAGMLSGNPTPSGLQEVVAQAARFAETTALEYKDPTFNVACKAGCHWCCMQAVRVSPPEVFRIVRAIRSMTDDDQEELISRLRELDKVTRGKSGPQREKLKLACAFLTDDLCGIYDARPLACAAYSSANVKDCKKRFRKGSHKVNITQDNARAVAYRAVQRGLFLGMAKALPAAETTGFELTAAVLAALDYPDAETAWLEGKPVFEIARIKPRH